MPCKNATSIPPNPNKVISDSPARVGKSASRQVGKSASRHVDVTLPAEGPARGLGGDHPGGDACFGPRRATNTALKMPTENSAQIPRVLVMSHRGSFI